MVKQLDQRIAAQESMMARPLTETNVREHYACVGLDSDAPCIAEAKVRAAEQGVAEQCHFACCDLLALQTGALRTGRLGDAAATARDPAATQISRLPPLDLAQSESAWSALRPIHQN